MEDVEKLNIDLNRLEHLCEKDTPYVLGFSDRNVRKSLRKYIESEARNNNADIAVITTQGESYGTFTQEVNYAFSLYKYK